jgi:APA family basic amino acid/polyamine antiporter
MQPRPLRRIIGSFTALLIGMGVAIGSGIFRNPGLVARDLGERWLILLAWLLAGLIVLMQCMVTAELATRFPKAGGEYVYLREAYGDFMAFFFGWGYTVFIIGAGSAAISRALGEFSCQLLSLPEDTWAGSIAAVAIAAVVVVNALGLRVGAGFQNALTIAKALALLAVIMVGLIWGGPQPSPAEQVSTPPDNGVGTPWLALFMAAITWALWPYQGANDTIKLAEEIKDVRRALPRAVIGAALLLTLLYVLFNFALLRLAPVEEISRMEAAGEHFVPGAVMPEKFGAVGRSSLLVVAILACLGALGSTILATIRVTFALGRDGLAFRGLGRMSDAQAPVAALLVVGVFAAVLVLSRTFENVLQIYFLAAAILFGLSYATLFVFRWSETSFPEHAYRCPLGRLLAGALILIQAAIALNICLRNPRDALYTAVLLAIIGTFYAVWRMTGGKRRQL